MIKLNRNSRRQRKNEIKTENAVLIPPPDCELFQVYGNKFKPDPICDMGKTSVQCIMHTIFFFDIGDHTFYCSFSFLIKFFVFRNASSTEKLVKQA